jgi:thioredoxin-dependent peroxiredoxin
MALLPTARGEVMRLTQFVPMTLLLVAFTTQPAFAVLKVGDEAPDFAADAALGGKPFTFRLSEALAKGPVVLYFYPKAFTKGCTIEANAFAEATPRFHVLGATVIGISNDNIETLKRFSVEACRNQFAVAADAQSKLIRAYDAASTFSRSMAARVSYVIDRSGRIAFTHDSMWPEGHITETLKVIEKLQARPAQSSSATAPRPSRSTPP